MALPLQQKALANLELPGPFTLISRPVPIPTGGDVLVKIESTGLNPAEYKMRRDGSLVVKEYPAIVGFDGAGHVAMIGGDVKGIEVGDRVVFQGWLAPDRGTYQEYVLINAQVLAKVPEVMTFQEASTIPCAMVTAAFGLTLPYDSKAKLGGAGLKPFWEDGAKGCYQGRPIVVLGGSSSVGQFAIQIASYLGFGPIITTASLHNAEYLKSLGATHVIDRHGDASAVIKTILPSTPVDLIFDAVHCPITQSEVDLLAPGGVMLSIGNVPETGLDISENKRVSLFYGIVGFHIELSKEMYKFLTKFLENGVIKPNRFQKLEGGLAGITEGLNKMEKGEISGIKLVVSPSETPAL